MVTLNFDKELIAVAKSLEYKKLKGKLKIIFPSTLIVEILNNKNVRSNNMYCGKLNKAINQILDNEKQINLELGNIYDFSEAIMNESSNDILQTEDILSYAYNNSRNIKNIFDTNNISAIITYSGDENKEKNLNGTNLDKFSINLVDDNYITGTLIGRENELNQLMEVLLRKSKSNAVLIGDAGVGKTAIVEGLASRIKKKDVPKALQEVKILQLDIPALLAGTKYRGEFEERLINVIKEIKASDREIILFIDEIHTIVGAGGGEGGIDAGNILKPSLARGEIKVIGATTIDEYAKYFEKDAALNRRFQRITVLEPSLNETKIILRGIKPDYEKFHHITLHNSILDYIAECTQRRIHDRKQPDKSIDILDIVSSKKNLSNESRVVKKEDVDSVIESYTTLQNKGQNTFAMMREKFDYFSDYLGFTKAFKKELIFKMRFNMKYYIHYPIIFHIKSSNIFINNYISQCILKTLFSSEKDVNTIYLDFNHMNAARKINELNDKEFSSTEVFYYFRNVNMNNQEIRSIIETLLYKYHNSKNIKNKIFFLCSLEHSSSKVDNDIINKYNVLDLSSEILHIEEIVKKQLVNEIMGEEKNSPMSNEKEKYILENINLDEENDSLVLNSYIKVINECAIENAQ
ncbi:MAG: ATP-dependent Clp protease ATP-binding subunit ClpC [Thermoanaerobacter sp.]|nr:ATP-dependent Clp protease ATP-binding subunit ClpC [Thermoanaerobacter sp.]